MKKILFYPGTFNPPHLGHVSAVTVALKDINFDEVWIMPSGKRVDKEIPTSLEDRKNMAGIFIEYLKSVIPTPIKLLATAVEKTNHKYTHELIMELKDQNEYEIYQLVGIDGYLSIKERIIGSNEKFIIIKRSGYEFPENITSNSNLVILEEVGGISSTMIREMVKMSNVEYKKLVPNKIASYIEEMDLYL